MIGLTRIVLSFHEALEVIWVDALKKPVNP
jgi:hypothetical protein